MASPNKQNALYKEYLSVWQKCRDAAAGQRAIKNGGEKYLRRLTEQTQDEYESYKDRASYFNATGRTVDAMEGMVFRKDTAYKAPQSINDWLEDINLSGETLEDLARLAVRENLVVGRGAFLVDMPVNNGQAITIADKLNQSIRPYIVLYKAESILNWKCSRVNNLYQITDVWLDETTQNDDGEDEPQIRHLSLQDGYYGQYIYRSEKSGSDWQLVEVILPTRNGERIDIIPFFPFGSVSPKIDVQDPPIESLADVNIAHYKNSADIEHGSHIAGLPTPYITGLTGTFDENGKPTKDDSIKLGTTTILNLPQDATAGFLQCGNEGFATIEKLMDRKEQQMAALGARMLAPEKRQAEASETHSIKRSAENSVLATVARVVERQLEKALIFAVEWENISGEVSIELNTDYVPVSFTAQDLTAWTAAMQSGAISGETYFDILKYSENLPDSLTYEEEQERKSNDPPALGEMVNATES